MSVLIRDRADRCPGILRPWPAADGLLVRVRLIGGHVTAAQLRGLVAAASAFGDGRVRPTTRANLQLRAFPGADGVLDADALAAIEASGLLPAPAHDRVRNITVSPQTGLGGGRADLRPLAAELDALIVGSDVLPGLPGKFAIVLDDKVISAPVIQSHIPGGSGIITGNFDVAASTELAVLLRAGALPAKMTGRSAWFSSSTAASMSSALSCGFG